MFSFASMLLPSRLPVFFCPVDCVIEFLSGPVDVVLVVPNTAAAVLSAIW